MVSTMTEISASITGLWKIPQCSFSSASVALSDKEKFPYFFRTSPSVVLYGEALVDWVYKMGWKSCTLIYTNSGVGRQGN